MERRIDDVQVICKLLQGTITAADTDRTLTVVLGKEQFDRIFPVHPHFRTVCVENHPVFHDIITGCDQFLFSLHFYNADTAGANLVDLFQIT